jgi:hypothetical protein
MRFTLFVTLAAGLVAVVANPLGDAEKRCCDCVLRDTVVEARCCCPT